MKRYFLNSYINGNESQSVFFSRKSAIKRMTKLLDQNGLEVSHVIKKDRKHFCEYVCTNNRDRIFIRRVFI